MTLRTAAVAICLLASGGLRAPLAAAAPIDPLLPEDTDFVLSVNVKQLFASPLFQKYAAGEMKKAVERNADAVKALTAMGLDPMTSFDRVTLAGTTGKPDKLFAVVRGPFDKAKVMAKAAELAREPGARLQVVPAGGATLLKFGEGRSTLYSAPVDGGMVVASVPEQVQAALARTGGKPAVRKEMADLIGKADEGQSFYMAGLTAGAVGKLPVPVDDPALKQTLEQIQSVSGSVAVTADAKVALTFGLKDAKAAGEFGKLMEDGLVFAKNLLPQLAANNPQMALVVDLVNSLRPEAKGSGVTLTGDIPGGSFEKALK